MELNNLEIISIPQHLRMSQYPLIFIQIFLKNISTTRICIIISKMQQLFKSKNNESFIFMLFKLETLFKNIFTLPCFLNVIIYIYIYIYIDNLACSMQQAYLKNSQETRIPKKMAHRHCTFTLLSKEWCVLLLHVYNYYYYYYYFNKTNIYGTLL